MGKLLAGAAKVNVTPPIGTPLSGYSARKDVSQGIHDDLFVEALVLDDGKKEIAFLSADLLAFSWDLVKEIEREVLQREGIPPNHLFLWTTHTHSGPDTLGGLYSIGQSSRAWLEVLRDKIVGAIHFARLSKRSCRVGIGWGKIEGIAFNRRHLPTGKPVDPEVGVVYVESTDNGPLAVLVNYACHAVVLGPDNLFISADYPGYLRELLEHKLPGMVVLFANGAEGDVNTGHSAELSAIGETLSRRTFARVKKIGTILSQEVLKIVERIQWLSSESLRTAQREIFLPFRSLPPRDEIMTKVKMRMRKVARLTGRRSSTKEIEKAKIEKMYSELMLSVINETSRFAGGGLKILIQGFALGKRPLLICLPGEVFVEIGLRIKRSFSVRPVLVIGLSRGWISYIPTQEAWEEGGYEVLSSWFNRGAGEIIEQKASEVLTELMV